LARTVVEPTFSGISLVEAGVPVESAEILGMFSYIKNIVWDIALLKTPAGFRDIVAMS
jgi:hypothetical protein